jgi:hypothetical protein
LGEGREGNGEGIYRGRGEKEEEKLRERGRFP